MNRPDPGVDVSGSGFLLKSRCRSPTETVLAGSGVESDKFRVYVRRDLPVVSLIQSLREALKAWQGFRRSCRRSNISSVGISSTRRGCVTRGSDQFIAQCVNQACSRQRIQENIQTRCGKHLSGEGTRQRLVCSRPCDRQLFFPNCPDGSRWRIMKKVPGIAFRRCESAEQARSAAIYAARFHNALSRF